MKCQILISLSTGSIHWSTEWKPLELPSYQGRVQIFGLGSLLSAPCQELLPSLVTQKGSPKLDTPTYYGYQTVWRDFTNVVHEVRGCNWVTPTCPGVLDENCSLDNCTQPLWVQMKPDGIHIRTMFSVVPSSTSSTLITRPLNLQSQVWRGERVNGKLSYDQ